MRKRNLIIFIVLALLVMPMVFGAIDYDQALLYWKFDDNLAESVNGENTLIEDFEGYITGVVGNAISLEKSSSQDIRNATINTSKFPDTNTIVFWIKPETWIATDKVMTISNEVANHNTYFEYDAGGLRMVGVESGATPVVRHDVSTSAIGVGTWTHIVIKWNATAVYIFENGSITPDDFDTDNEKILAYPRIKIGSLSTFYFDGAIDNLYFTEQEFGDAEIIASYNGGLGLDYSLPSDTTPPEVELYYPENNTITQNQSVVFYYYQNDTNIDYCSIYLDEVLDQTNTTPINDYIYNNSFLNTTSFSNSEADYEIVTIKSFEDNPIPAYVFNVTALLKTTNGDETAYSRVMFLYSDDTHSNISESIYGLNWGNINFTNPTPAKAIKTITTFVKEASGGGDHVSQLVNISINYYRNVSTFLIGSIPSGFHNWSVKCYDVATNSNMTLLRSFRVDITAPVIDNYSPANNSLYPYNNNITFQMNTTDDSFIYLALRNISYPNGSKAYLINYTDTTDEELLSYSLNGSIKLSVNGTYSDYMEVCDGHTLESIGNIIADPKINILNKEIDFSGVKWLPKDPNNMESVSYEKLKDRYIIEWNLKEEKKTEIDLISVNKLDYFPRSNYAGHFVVGNKRLWIDHEGMEDLKITKISDYHYIIETTPTTKDIKVRSIGVLNCFNQTSYFSINTMGLDLHIQDYSSGANLTNFSARVLNNSWESDSNTGLIEFNLSSGNYTIEINKSGYVMRNITKEIIGHENLTTYLYLSNSVQVNIYDEDDGSLIVNSSVLFNANTTYYTEHSTTNGSMYITDLPTGAYDLEVSSSGYTTRHYPITLTGSNYVTQNAYLLNGSNQVKLVIKSESSDKFLEGASVVLTRNINGTWSTIETQTTDGVGAVRFGMKEGYEYIIYITATDYGTKVFTLRPYEDSYTIYLTSSTSTDFYDLFNKLSYSVNPHRLVIPPSSLPNPITCFNLTTLSSGGYIDYFGLSGSLNGSMNSSNITGSPTGSTAEFCLNLSSFSGYNISVSYWIKANGEDLYSFSRKYYIDNRTYGSLTEYLGVSSWSIIGILEEYGDKLTTTWKIIIMSLTAIALMLTFAYWLPPAILGFIGLSVIAMFSFVWFSEFMLIVMILTLVMAIVYLIGGNKGGAG